MGIFLPFALTFLFLLASSKAFDETNAGCFFDIDMVNPDPNPIFSYTAGWLANASPYNCYLECLKMDVVRIDRPITIGLSEGNICLCGYESGDQLNIHGTQTVLLVAINFC